MPWLLFSLDSTPYNHWYSHPLEVNTSSPYFTCKKISLLFRDLFSNLWKKRRGASMSRDAPDTIFPQYISDVSCMSIISEIYKSLMVRNIIRRILAMLKLGTGWACLFLSSFPFFSFSFLMLNGLHCSVFEDVHRSWLGEVTLSYTLSKAVLVWICLVAYDNNKKLHSPRRVNL